MRERVGEGLLDFAGRYQGHLARHHSPFLHQTHADGSPATSRLLRTCRRSCWRCSSSRRGAGRSRWCKVGLA